MNVLFFGTPDFSVPALRALIESRGVSVGAVLTQPDRPSGRGGKISMSPIKQLALQHAIPIFQPTSLRKEFASLRANLEAHGPFDIGVVVAFGQILPVEVLNLPTHGCVNIHASLLPRWRGAAPIQRSIQAGDSETGVCLMQMDAGLDTGAVYQRLKIPITPADTGATLHDKLASLGASHLVAGLHGIVSGDLRAVPQSTEGITYASKITTEECRIRWNLPAREIALAVRAFSPWPGCFTVWREKRLKILFASESRRTYPALVAPGTIVYAQGDRLEIACANGSALCITDLQLEGKKRMAVDEFLRGAAFPEGETIAS
ncbi:MAG: methionyl-tRNA formyltransferase [Pseudomonadota bacterium]